MFLGSTNEDKSRTHHEVAVANHFIYLNTHVVSPGCVVLTECDYVTRLVGFAVRSQILAVHPRRSTSRQRHQMWTEQIFPATISHVVHSWLTTGQAELRSCGVEPAFMLRSRRCSCLLPLSLTVAQLGERISRHDCRFFAIRTAHGVR